MRSGVAAQLEGLARDYDDIASDLERGAIEATGQAGAVGRGLRYQGCAIRTAIKKRAFLAGLSAGSSVSAACRAADIGRSAAYDWRGADADFTAAWDGAFEDGTDRLEDELNRCHSSLRGGL